MSSFPQGTEDDPIIIGEPDSVRKRMRIVHISDTHKRHIELAPLIPQGDILIHSGDFGQYGLTRHFFGENDYLTEIKAINNFFSQLPHKYKIFVAGNHEMNFTSQTRERSKELLTDCIYLQDSWVTIEGIKVYGSPWNFTRKKSWARGFACPCSHIGEAWTYVPDDVDVLITHQHPLYASRPVRSQHMVERVEEGFCLNCRHKHSNPDLLQVVLKRIRPKVHLFGHIHSDNGVIRVKNTIFCNAAMAEHPHPKVIDYYFDPSSACDSQLVPQTMAPSLNNHASNCILM